VSAVKAFKSLRLDRTSIICQVGRSLLLSVSEWNPRHWHFWGRNSFGSNASGQHP